MPTAIPRDTAKALGEHATECESRSLFASRFADPASKEDARKAWFNRLTLTKAVSFSPWKPPAAHFLHGQLKSRLMVNMAGGVMENAGLSLDRHGLPLIPGSAIKGCARHAALAALREWCETGTKPAEEDNLFRQLCSAFDSPAALLTAIAHTFGWVEVDWSLDKNKNGAWRSDLAWACEHDMESFTKAATALASQKQFAGSIAFLAARPDRDSGLILDVVTPHHSKYYGRDQETATDTEEPVPVYFPAVKEQGEHGYFTFPLIPLRRADQSLVTFAQDALRTGLEVFGIGAKTNAGYGWFDASEELNARIKKRQDEATKQKEDDERRAAEKARKAAEDQARAEAKAKQEAMLDGLTPDEKEDKKLEWLTDQQFETKVRNFCKDPKRGGPAEPEKQAIVRALRGPRIKYWQDFKTKATKGDLATVDQAIRQLSKTLNLGKMP